MKYLITGGAGLTPWNAPEEPRRSRIPQGGFTRNYKSIINNLI